MRKNLEHSSRGKELGPGRGMAIQKAKPNRISISKCVGCRLKLAAGRVDFISSYLPGRFGLSRRPDSGLGAGRANLKERCACRSFLCFSCGGATMTKRLQHILLLARHYNHTFRTNCRPAARHKRIEFESLERLVLFTACLLGDAIECRQKGLSGSGSGGLTIVRSDGEARLGRK